MPAKRAKNKRSLAARADKYRLYEQAVQEPEADIDFAVDTFRSEFARRPRRLREDFCGTAAVCCEWVRAHARNRAWGVDLAREPLEWSRKHHLAALKASQRRRVRLVQGDVRGAGSEPVDVVLAQNFSYFLLRERRHLVGYFRAAHRNLDHQGLLVLDAYGGPDSVRRASEATEYDDFVYEWDQDDFDPIGRMATCHIHFEFPDGSRLERAFSYHWRMYTIPEIRDALDDAGFTATEAYWEGVDPDTDEGDGVYTAQVRGTPDDAWVAYIVGIKR